MFGADEHRHLQKNYLKLGNNYGIGFRVRLGIGLVFRFIDIQWYNGPNVHQNLQKTTENLVIITV